MKRLAKVGGRICLVLLLLAFVAGIGGTIVALPTAWSGLSDQVSAELDASGVRNPVTAVLLNFRGYDTLLEICVLLLAAIAVRSGATEREQTTEPLRESPSPVLIGLLRLVAPLVVLVAGYLLWAGGHAPGGAFPAGAVLASLVVLLQLGDPRRLRPIPDWLERLLLSLGLLTFIGTGLATMAFEDAFLEYPAGQAKWLILVVEAACTLSIAVVLGTLFVGGRIGQSCRAESNVETEQG